MRWLFRGRLFRDAHQSVLGQDRAFSALIPCEFVASIHIGLEELIALAKVVKLANLAMRWIRLLKIYGPAWISPGKHMNGLSGVGLRISISRSGLAIALRMGVCCLASLVKI